MREYAPKNSILRVNEDDAYGIEGCRVGDLLISIDADRARFVSGSKVSDGETAWWYIPSLDFMESDGFTLMKTVLDEDRED